MCRRRGELGGRIACISFAEPALLDAYRRDLGLDVELYADVSRAAYEAFGFERGSVARVWLDPRVWARYAVLLARGRRPKRPAEDPLQLGGDVVADRDGAIRWVYRSAGPEDRPAVDEVVAAVRAAAAAG